MKLDEKSNEQVKLGNGNLIKNEDTCTTLIQTKQEDIRHIFHVFFVPGLIIIYSVGQLNENAD